MQERVNIYASITVDTVTVITVSLGKYRVFKGYEL